MIKHTTHNILNYSKITKYIYIGNNMCCQMHFDKKLLKKGVSVDISLEKERIDSPYGIDFFIWLPTKDHTAPDLSKLIFGVKTINHFVKEKKKIYVHCKNGHGRAPTLVIAYLIFKGMTAEKAIKFIKKKRPVIHFNKLHKNMIKRFEKYVKKSSL